MTTTTHELVALSDSDQTIATPAEDIRGMTCRASGGEELGEVDDLLIDTDERKVRFLVIASGGFLGLGEHKSYVPVDAVTDIRDNEVHIGQTAERLASAPGYDPELVNDRTYSEGVYGYYGYPPYWAPSYMYPGYPYAR